SSSAAIRNCISKASVSAQSFVGGIAGQGLILTDNAAILKVSDCTERSGAVAGFVDLSAENSEVVGNCFVDRGTAGIDGISYAGAAFPVEFEEFARLAGSTAVIDVTFIVEGRTADTIQVDFGAALPEDRFPQIPAKEGCFARWTEFDNECITFPTEVEAVYTPFVTLIESAKKSEKSPLVLAGGIFGDGSSVTVTTESSSIFPPDDSELRLVEVHNDLADGEITQLRFLAPESRGSLNVMQYVNGAWKNVAFTQNGHYLIVENPQLENGSGAFCVQRTKADYVPALIIGGGAVLLLTNIILWAVILKRKRAAKKAQKSAQKNAQP
ncbi:MAG: hypothetical protein ACI4Q4_07930, partial [Oscillospiraceae bacterium]